MKYVVTWQLPHKPASEESLKRAFEVFSKKPQQPGLNFIQLLGRVDNHGGFAVMETDDPTTIIKEAAFYQPFFEYYVYPVVDIEAFAQSSGESLSTLSAL